MHALAMLCVVVRGFTGLSSLLPLCGPLEWPQSTKFCGRHLHPPRHLPSRPLSFSVPQFLHL